MNRYKMTKECTDKAARLKSIWTLRKRTLDLTQAKAAKELGFARQSTVSQYLNGFMPLSVEATLKFAKLLEVDPTQIDPKITDLFVDWSQAVSKVRIPVLGTLEMGALESVYLEVPLEDGKPMYAVKVDTDSIPGLSKGDHVICNPEEFPVEGDQCIARMTDHRYKLVELIHADRQAFTMRDIVTGETTMYPINDIIQIDPVVATHAAKKNRPRRLHPKVARYED